MLFDDFFVLSRWQLCNANDAPKQMIESLKKAIEYTYLHVNVLDN